MEGGGDLLLYYPTRNCPGCRGSSPSSMIGRVGFFIPPGGSKLVVIEGK